MVSFDTHDDYQTAMVTVALGTNLSWLIANCIDLLLGYFIKVYDIVWEPLHYNEKVCNLTLVMNGLMSYQ